MNLSKMVWISPTPGRYHALPRHRLSIHGIATLAFVVTAGAVLGGCTMKTAPAGIRPAATAEPPATEQTSPALVAEALAVDRAQMNYRLPAWSAACPGLREPAGGFGGM